MIIPLKLEVLLHTQIKNSLLSQINGATHTFKKGVGGNPSLGVTASDAGGSDLWIDADYLGNSDYGTEFIVQKEIQEIPFIAGSPAYGINIYNTWSGLSQSICAPTLTPTGAVPNCEITATTPNTQFFAESTNYQYILWSISSVQAPLGGDPLTNESAVTFTQQGIIDWTPGWYGQFNLNATAVGCDGILTNTSTKAITIQSRTATPTDIFIKGGSDLPGCPGGRSTTEFDSDPGAGNSVTWEIDTNAAGVINCDTGILTWNPTFSGNC